jgi:hypothetical protein
MRAVANAKGCAEVLGLRRYCAITHIYNSVLAGCIWGPMAIK